MDRLLVFSIFLISLELFAEVLQILPLELHMLARTLSIVPMLVFVCKLISTTINIRNAEKLFLITVILTLLGQITYSINMLFKIDLSIFTNIFWSIAHILVLPIIYYISNDLFLNLSKKDYVIVSITTFILTAVFYWMELPFISGSFNDLFILFYPIIGIFTFSIAFAILIKGWYLQKNIIQPYLYFAAGFIILTIYDSIFLLFIIYGVDSPLIHIVYTLAFLILSFGVRGLVLQLYHISGTKVSSCIFERLFT